MLSLAEDGGGFEGAFSLAASPLIILFMGTEGAAGGVPLGMVADGDIVGAGAERRGRNEGLGGGKRRLALQDSKTALTLRKRVIADGQWLGFGGFRKRSDSDGDDPVLLGDRRLTDLPRESIREVLDGLA